MPVSAAGGGDGGPGGGGSRIFPDRYYPLLGLMGLYIAGKIRLHPWTVSEARPHACECATRCERWDPASAEIVWATRGSDGG